MSFRDLFSTKTIKKKAASFLVKFKRDTPQLPLLPDMIEIETTTTCNVNPPCVMCCRSWGPFTPVAFIPQELIEKLSHLFPCLGSVSLHGIGEPLMQEGLFSLMGRFSPTTRISFNSNGVLLDKKKILQLIKNRLAKLNVSLDAADPLTYKKIRGSDYFSIVKNNLCLLSAIKKDLHIDYPKLWINMTLMNENLAEVVNFVRLAKEIGADAVEMHLLNKISSNYCIDSDSFHFDYAAQMVDVSSPLFLENLKAAKTMADELSIGFFSAQRDILRVIKSGTRQSHDRKNGRKKYFCLKPWRNAFIAINGDIWICCHMAAENRIIGNLRDIDFSAIWHSDRIISIRKDIASGIRPSVCCNCPEFEW